MSDLPRLALSIRQPWAAAIVHLGKDVENRDWPTRLRGPIAIHASKTLSQDDINAFHETVRDRIDLAGRPSLYFPEEPRGGIVGMAEIVDCVEASSSPWFFGRYGFVLRDARPVDFIPVKGALGFFDWRRNLP